MILQKVIRDLVLKIADCFLKISLTSKSYQDNTSDQQFGSQRIQFTQLVMIQPNINTCPWRRQWNGCCIKTGLNALKIMLTQKEALILPHLMYFLKLFTTPLQCPGRAFFSFIFQTVLCLGKTVCILKKNKRNPELQG